MQLRERLNTSLASFTSPFPVDACLILGTGLGDTLAQLQDQGLELVDTIAYEDIVAFPHSSVVSHKGDLVFARFNELTLCIFQGRFHLYEGWSALDAAFPVYLGRELGARTLIISNAAGALNPEFTVGGLMVIEDHLNLTGHNPLIGWKDETIGSLFPDMSQAYSSVYSQLAHNSAKEAGVFLHRGVYAGVLGPSLETSAERRWLRSAGGDAVGMSTVMEVIAAKQCGMDVLGISAITNVATGLDDQPADSIENVLAAAATSAKKFSAILPGILASIN
ncbi:MAG: purine-nucleoside phosphorylase [Pseudomonadales bacterium]